MSDTSLRVTWLPACHAPVLDSEGKLAFTDDLRIFVDAAPDEPANQPIGGSDCPHDFDASGVAQKNIFSGGNWAGSPAGRTRPEDNLYCDVDVKIFAGQNDGTLLHEIGHALGLMHEHQRADDGFVDPKKCEDLGADGMGDPANANGDGIYVTSYDFNSVMHYTLPGCPEAPGNDNLNGLSDMDRLAAQMLYPPPNKPILWGTGAYRSDRSVRVVADWLRRGASVGRPGIVNEGFLNDPSWRVTSTVLANPINKTTQALDLSGIAPGTYSVRFRVQDWWERQDESNATFTVLSPSKHTALFGAVLL
jgi:hypothetical protein